MLSRLSSAELTTFEITGIILSIGAIFGASGLNVAHELGHKKSKVDQFLSKVYTDIFSKYLSEQGYDAGIVKTDYVGEESDVDPEK